MNWSWTWALHEVPGRPGRLQAVWRLYDAQRAWEARSALGGVGRVRGACLYVEGDQLVQFMRALGCPTELVSAAERYRAGFGRGVVPDLRERELAAEALKGAWLAYRG